MRFVQRTSESIIAILSGESVKVRIRTYQKDKTAFIPNEEIRSEFIDAVKECEKIKNRG